MNIENGLRKCNPALSIYSVNCTQNTLAIAGKMNCVTLHCVTNENGGNRSCDVTGVMIANCSPSVICLSVCLV